MHGLVTGLRDGPRHLLPLGSEVQLLGVPAAELVRPHTEPVASRLPGHLDDVRPGGERGDQLVHSGARQLQPAHDVGGGERPVPVEEELKNIESPGHGRYEASHNRPPPLLSEASVFEISTDDRHDEHRLRKCVCPGNGSASSKYGKGTLPAERWPCVRCSHQNA